MSLLSLFNTLITYLVIGRKTTQNIYNKAPEQVTLLSVRTFGTWTAITAGVRLITAYNITNRHTYYLTLWTFIVAVWHFGSEWAVYRTATWDGVKLSLILDVGTPIWMLYGLANGWYVY
jgi:hypothetical protein